VMKQAGRASWLLVLAILAIVIVVGLAFMSSGSPTSAAAKFLWALQRHNVDELVELSNVPEGDKAKLRQDWEFNLNVASKYYNFAWGISHAKQITNDQAVVAVKIKKNAEKPTAYEENFELPMVKVNGQWKVDIYRLSRKIYPSLPRMGRSE